jgi:hypothetical protein
MSDIDDLRLQVAQLRQGLDAITERLDNIEDGGGDVLEFVTPLGLLEHWAAEQRETIPTEQAFQRLLKLVDSIRASLRMLGEEAIPAEPALGFRGWCRSVLNEVIRYKGRGLATVLYCLQKGTQDAHGELAELFGERRPIGDTGRFETVRAETADAVTNFGVAATFLGRALGGPGEVDRQYNPDIPGPYPWSGGES